MIAHIGGVPIEEALASVTVAGAGLAVACRWIQLHVRRRRKREHDSQDNTAHAAQTAQAKQ